MERPPHSRRAIQIPLTTRARVSRDVDEELHVHLAMRVEELMRRGTPREDAERQARAEFGDVDAARRALIDEDMRRVARTRRRVGLETWRQDIRYGWRQLLRQRVFTVVALLTLALGTGVTMAIFSVVDAILLRPLPYEQPQELVRLFSTVRGNRRSFSVPDFLDYRQQTKTLRGLAAYYDGTTNYVHQGDPTRLNATRASDNFFALLEMRPLLGRTFAPGEDEPTAPRVAVLNESLWRSAFGSDSTVLGRTLQLDGQPTVVIGVVRSEQEYPLGTDLWVTTRFSQEERNPDQRGARWIRVIGRLAPGATVNTVQSELTGVAQRLAQLDTAHNTNVGSAVMSLQESMVGSLEKPLFTLLVAVAFVLLIATVNVANLSLARTTARESELAVRAALGAGQRRLMRQLVTECALLAVAGTVLGAVIARVSLGALIAIAPGDLPRLDAVRMDARVYGFGVLLAAVGGLAIGLVPALHVSAVNVAQRLREGARGVVRGAAERRRKALVVGEVALAVVLLIGAGLMVRTLGALRRVDPGFDPANVYIFTVTLPQSSYATEERQHQFAVETEQRLRALPGVTDTGMSFGLPLVGARFSLTFTVRGRPEPPAGNDMGAQVRIATPGYFSVLKMPIKRGRHLAGSDVATSPRMIVISEELARRYFPNEDPIGLYLETGWGRDSTDLGGTVVGIVGDVRSEALNEPVEPFLYVPEAQWPFDEPTFALRTAGPPGSVATAVRETLRSIDATLPIFDAQPLTSVVSASVGQQRFLGQILSLFSVLAVALSAIGIYGVVAYGVEQRRRELGVRLALGASRDRVLGLVLRDGVRLALLGGALGVAGAIALTQLLDTVLFGVEPTDPLTLAAVTVGLLGVAVVASLAPAVRASRVQPTSALREG
ncbi:MAG: ADOP family duplicated permease [Gemmatimonadaceae bacterium]